MTHDDDEPTGYTGDREHPPAMDRMAHFLQLWDTTTGHPRGDGDYLSLASDLLDISNDEDIVGDETATA